MTADGGTARSRHHRPPRGLFFLELSYLVLLSLVFVAYEEVDGFRDLLPRSLGQFPTAAPWFGATGAVLAGLSGHFMHDGDWKDSYNRWHVSRPLLGAIEGPIGCVILIVVVHAASTHPAGSQPRFYDVAAFLVGFAEKTFRELIDRGTKLIIGPGNTSSDAGSAGKPTALG